jgi:ABC-type multidrug transport system fused ATPase/permease subunit
MTDLTTFKLNEIDPEDISDILMQIQKSFKIKFGYADFRNCKTYGDLCDVISIHLIGYIHLNDCTSQQAFYKIRELIISFNPQNLQTTITPNTLLEELFPKSVRRKQIKLFKQKLGLKVHILSMKSWLSLLLIIGLTTSLILFFCSWKLAGIVFLFLTILVWIANYFNNQFNIQTVGDLTKKLVATNYFHFRRNPASINKYEIQTLIDHLFIQNLGVDKTELYKEASLGWN